MSCNICVEKFNKSDRTCLQCDFCQFEACRVCCETYIIGQLQEAHCMSCKKEWTRKILLDKFTKKFVNSKYKTHRENYLFEIEQALLPATQPIVERHLKIAKITESIDDVKNQIRDLVIKKHQLMNSLSTTMNKPKETKTVFVRKCPCEDCRGFLSSQWKCGLCEVWVCPDCNEIKGFEKSAEHTCIQSNVESVQLLNKDSNPCPKCSVLIFKTSGCDQMFCTMCHTAFSWKTGAIETNIHNPHYFEWMKSRGSGVIERNPLDFLCGREIDQYFINQLGRMHINDEKFFYMISIRLHHINQVEIPFFNRTIHTNEATRVRYLKNEITFEQFKSLIQRQDKKNSKNHEVANLLGMFVTNSTEILYRLFDEYNNNRKLDFFEYSTELNSLKDYVNECFDSISTVYNCSHYYVNANFNLLKGVKK